MLSRPIYTKQLNSINSNDNHRGLLIVNLFVFQCNNIFVGIDDVKVNYNVHVETKFNKMRADTCRPGPARSPHDESLAWPAAFIGSRRGPGRAIKPGLTPISNSKLEFSYVQYDRTGM